MTTLPVLWAAPSSAEKQQIPVPPSVGILSTYPPTACGLATFSAALCAGLRANRADVHVVRIADGASTSSSDQVIGEMISGSRASIASAAGLLNLHEVVVIQHEYGIYGGRDGEDIIDVLEGVDVPVIVVAHTVLARPTAHQRTVFEQVAALADVVVVMSEVAHQRLRCGYEIDRRKIVTIAHGAMVPRAGFVKRAGRPTLLTWGLLGPGKGIERVVGAMGSLHKLPGRPRYLISGQTHPRVLAHDGEAYREALIEQARSCGVTDSVYFDPEYHNSASLLAMVQSASAVVLPYDSTDQVTSGVLVGAIASGRPVVATAFPHAVEILSSGAGIVVDHDDPAALVAALRTVLTDPRLAGAMAAEARRLAPALAWPVVAGTYVDLAQRLCAARRAPR